MVVAENSKYEGCTNGEPNLTALRRRDAAIWCPDDACCSGGCSVPFAPAAIAACVPGAVFEAHMRARKMLVQTLLEEVRLVRAERRRGSAVGVVCGGACT
jgi:hypothetical protein